MQLQTSHLVLLATICFGSQAVFAQSAQIEFNKQIKPILSDRCFKCHGPDAANRKAQLRLDLPESVRTKTRDQRRWIINLEDPANSELYRRIRSGDAGVRMPPPVSKLTLSAAEIELIRRWIEQGAPWQTHWSFVVPGDVKLPTIQQRGWPNNEIDYFILSAIESAGLKPQSEAERARLIRRVSFDLIGLPPTLEEIDRFLEDREPGAYERLVNRLLKSQRYGERMASDWLDVARYSDTYGYQVDRDRHVWPWRDWVIGAFNSNLGYDEFITQQLAGDLLPGATRDQILATTFNRLHPQKVEGGSVPEEFRIEYVSDRTQTFATAFLGLTLECARCHDHKYDPILQKEYYQLTAFFDKIDEAGLYSYFTSAVPTPTLLLSDRETDRKLVELEPLVRKAEADLAATAEQRRPQFRQWLENWLTSRGERPDSFEIPGRVAHLDFEGSVAGGNESVAGKIGKAIRLSGDDGIGVKVGNFRRFEPFSVAFWMKTPDQKSRAVVFHRSRAWTDAGSRGYQLLIEQGALSASLIHFWPGNAIRVRTANQIPLNQWIHVAMTYDGSSRADGLALYLDGRPAELEVVRDNLYKNITGGGGDNITIGERFRDKGFAGGVVDEFQVYSRELTGLEVASLFDAEAISSSAAVNSQTRAAWYEYYLAAHDGEYRARLSELKSVRERRSKLVDGISEIMVMRPFAARETYLLQRGAYNARGVPVAPGTPAILPKFSQSPDRLGLARWLTDRDHPLTARVAVNRIWQMIFGSGLVRTPEDFGSQGEPPTHAELLDWLARDFVQHGWDVKRLVKQLVMSATYRQSSVASPAGLARDPENRWLARSPSYRLSAEMLRDNALAVSGLLANRVGGPPVKPYEVEVSFKPAKRDSGAGLYRRSLYTYWKRTGPAPAMMTLDAAKRDVCRVRRERTSSPLQSFVLMNGPQFVEAARVLAERLIVQHQGRRELVLRDLFRMLTSRNPDPAELAVISQLYDRALASYQQRPGEAEKYLGTGEAPRNHSIPAIRHAATAIVANALLSFDECVVKR